MRLIRELIIDQIELIMHVWVHEIVNSISRIKNYANKKKNRQKQSKNKRETQVFSRVKRWQGLQLR